MPVTAGCVKAVAAMHLPESVRNLVLVGFMGSGKSSVGREIARRWGFRFLDTDTIIRQKYRKSIPDIFATFGEPVFRDEENKALRDLQNSHRAVIATGGGIILQPRNHPLLRSLGVVVWLTASEEVIWERVSRNQNRPLLRTKDPRTTITQSDVGTLSVVSFGCRYYCRDLRVDPPGSRGSSGGGDSRLVSRRQ